MAKAVAISLAAKCQLLFGLAVLVIIAGALYVPWQRMEQLAGERNIQAARVLADNALRQIHADAATRSGLPSTQAAATAGSQPTTAPATGWNDASLPDVADYSPPRIIAVPSPTALPAGDRIATDALLRFRTHPKESDYGKIITQPDKKELYNYAAAVRLEISCLNCHSNWSTWPRPEPAVQPGDVIIEPATNTPATFPASTRPATIMLAEQAVTEWPTVAVIRVDLPVQIDANQQLLNRIVIVVAGMLGGTLAIVVFYLITNRLILQPVRVLRSTAEKVAQGDLNIRSAIYTGDEFQQLSETFNTMLATLKTSQDQLESTNRSLDTRVGELAQMNVDLYEANRMKSEFLTNVSHELRTPLNAIIGFADLLADRVADDQKASRYLENIHNSAKQLLDLINDLLDLAKIEAGKLQLREEKINVGDVCEAMQNFMKPLALKKNIELSLSVQPDLPLITTDAGRIQQILYNFLSNAVKFTPSEGKVSLAARLEDGEHIRISVTDTGPGIAPEHQQTIFEKFRQIDGSVTRQHSGTGLGLAISRELARILGGRIELFSSLGKGATFSVILPIILAEPVLGVRPAARQNESRLP